MESGGNQVADITVLYTTVGEWLDEARDRVLAAMLGNLAPGDEVEEHKVIPAMLATMQVLCDDGDEAVCALTRAWLWSSAETALAEFGEAHDRRVLSGGNDAAERWGAFVKGSAR